ncbi:MAG: NUDIX domain-containing protein [Pararhodobacter sp.]|nr:NUDIX domain-containing protein [Pararhodobacter sp.]
MAEALFLFGTLRHPPLLAVVAGSGGVAGEVARAPGRAAVRAVGADGRARGFPLLIERAGARAEGLFICPGAAARARINAYERAFGYRPEPISVKAASGTVQALYYAPPPGLWLPGGDWSLSGWVSDHAPFALAVAEEMMAQLPALAPGIAVRRLPMLERRVASRLRAQLQPAPASQRREPQAGDVTLAGLERPHTGFFALEAAELRFRRFDGSLSPEVRREGFVMADAVTVLPYDPLADQVLLVEQFRFGPFLRGDPNPWTLEPVAGHVDAGETPEQCARREAQEEAGLALRALHFIAGYYPSPGAVSEFVHSFVGLAALDGRDGSVNGLESEAEDIRAHVVGFDRLMKLVASGEAGTGPLVLSAHWLVRNRARLRAQARRHAL